MGVLEIEVVAARSYLFRGDVPRSFILNPPLAFRAAPPVGAGLQVFDPDGLGHRVGLLALGNAMFVEPDFLGRLALLEEQQVGADAGVGLEHAVGQPHDGMQVAFLQQVLLQSCLHAFAEQRPVGQHHRRASAVFQQPDDEGEEEVGGLARLEVLGEVALYAVFLAPAEGRIGEDDIHAVRLAVADVGAGERIVVAHERRVVDAVQQHVGDAQHVRKLFLFHSAQRSLHAPLVLRGLHVTATHVAQRAGEKSAGTAGGVEKNLARLRVDALGHEAGDGARRVVLARVAGALQIIEDLLVEVAKVLTLGEVVEVDGGNLVHHLAHELAGLHVVVGVLEYVPHHAAPSVPGGVGQLLERWEQIVVDEGEQRVTGDAFGVGRPGAPAKFCGDGRAVAILHQLQFLILVVYDLKKEHPAKLRDTLGVAIDADILAHDVLDGFDDIADGHGIQAALS